MATPTGHALIYANEGVPSDIKFTSAATNDSFMLQPSQYVKGDGESANAIKIQIWVTLIANLLLMVVQKRIKGRIWSFLGLATMVRITLMYYIDCYSFLNNPDRDWEKIIEQKKGPPIQLSLFDQGLVFKKNIRNAVFASIADCIVMSFEVQRTPIILDSEYLETNGLFLARFDAEMLFLSPEKSKAQAFLDEMPCSPNLDAIRKCIQDYIDGKTDIIYSADNWL